MHLKHLKDFTTSIPRSIGEGITLPEGFTFSDATPSPSLLNQAGNLQITNGDLQNANPFSSAHNNSNMPIVTISSNFSHITPADGQHNLLFNLGTNNNGSDGSNGGGNGGAGGLINPLHGLGLNLEHYPTLLQNLLGTSGDALDAMEFDPTLLNDTMLGGPGDAMLTSFGGPSILGTNSGAPGSNGGVGGPTTSSPPNGGGPSSSPNHALKRQRDDELDGSNAAAAKRSRFEIVE